MNDKTKFWCVDEEHNVWQCQHCGDMFRFEADGPYENGWNVCPVCAMKVSHGDMEDEA